MPYAPSGYYNRDPAEARVYSLRSDGDRLLSADFIVREFADRTSDRILIHPALSVALQTLRTRWRVPIRILSGYRTAGHNAAVGGDPNSLHLLGMAADISIPSSGDAAGIASYARDVLGMCVGLHASGTMHVSVGAEGGADRTIIDPGVYVAFRNLYPGGVDRTGALAGLPPDGTPAEIFGRRPLIGGAQAQIAAAGGGLVGGIALVVVGLAVIRSTADVGRTGFGRYSPF